VGEGEADAGQSHQGESAEDCPPGAESSRSRSTRQAADERAGGIGGHEHARSGLRQMERVREVRQERCERRVQHGVHPDHRADEDEKAAHWLSPYVRPTVRV
jgi:hypothetical protein